MRLLVQSLFKACSDLKRQDQGEPLGRRGRIGLAGALTVTGAQGPDYIGQWLSRWALSNVPESTVFLS